ncbi:unnamed protein product [Dracunculus medinensis]|uniref:Protein FMC1 homolog n=1 Tax=Dracunculus medinensis TaxID=318479 RepID=A0A0N4U3Y4_DRAME|nr:unnamed protein product [Dracunculus medinensis]
MPNIIKVRNEKFLFIIRSIFCELRKSDKNFSHANATFRFIIMKIRGNTKCLNENIDEFNHFASAYLHYLRSTRRLQELQQKYKGYELSIQDSAKLVGLKLPETRHQN